MILKQVESKEASYLGNIVENRVGIDRSNIDFITTLLTSNLYSKPLESFLRETVANAADSHVEAGTKEKILMLIQDSQENLQSKIISIRDYGTGVSPERFDLIYRNIGSSTKRTSNDYIGMFGIGRMSCLALCDVATINSYYNGTKYSYLMYKNGTGINIDKLSEETGNFKNGLEVSVTLEKFDNWDFHKALECLVLFDDLYIQYTGIESQLRQFIDEFNNRKVKRYKTFSTCDICSRYKNYGSVGNVLYSIDETSPMLYSSVITTLPMGEVNITPNREALQFTELTKKTVSKAKQEVLKELQEVLEKKVQEDLSVSSLLDIMYRERVVIDDTFYISLRDLPAFDLKNYSIEGIPLTRPFLDSLRIFGNYTIPRDMLLYVSDRRTYTGISFKSLFWDYLGHIYEKGEQKFREVTKDYYTTNSDIQILLNYEATEHLKVLFIDALKIEAAIPSSTKEKYAEFFIKQLGIKKFCNNDVPAQYVEEFKKNKKASRTTPSKNAEIRVYTSRKYSFMPLSNIFKSHRLYVYTAHTQKDLIIRDLSDCFSSVKYYNKKDGREYPILKFITVSKQDLPLLEGRKNCIRLEEFVTKRQKVLSKFFTAEKIRKEFPEIARPYFSKTYFNEPFYTKYGRYKSYVSSLPIINAIRKKYEENNWYIQEDLREFTLSEKEKELLRKKTYIMDHKDYYIRKILCKTLGINKKLGITLPEPLLKEQYYD